MAAIVELIDNHLAAASYRGLGFGADPYWSPPQVHPMACALYASGLSSLYVGTRAASHREAAESALEALRATSAHGSAWGLGFPYRHLDRDTPYTITTALVGRAFADHYLATGDESSREQTMRTAHWITEALPWSFVQGGAGPWFATGMPAVLPNVASMVGGFLHQAHGTTADNAVLRPARLAIAFVLAVQRPQGHWSYGFASGSPAGGVRPNDVVDAIHTAYILDGLNLALIWDGDHPGLRRAIRRGSEFLSAWLLQDNGRLLEKIVPIDDADPQSRVLLSNPRLKVRPFGPGNTLVSFPGESRLWGYGATLGALSRAHVRGLASRGPIERIVKRLLGVHLAEPSGRFRYLANDRRAFPRHEAHVVEGLAATLALARDSRTRSRSGW